MEPYPAFFEAIGAFAAHGQALTASLDLGGNGWLATAISGYFDRLSTIAGKLAQMAKHQRTGAPFTAEQMAFINEAVAVQPECGGASAEGWYAKLFFDGWKATAADPTIADVHTQPTDEHGAPVGRVLHVGTGHARLMVVTVNTCTGPRAYAGLASSYFERVTEGFLRLDDPSWSKELDSAPPDDVIWMKDLVTH